MRLEPIWWEWTIANENGFMCGIRDDAPEDIKKEYEKYLEEKEELKKKGIKI